MFDFLLVFSSIKKTQNSRFIVLKCCVMLSAFSLISNLHVEQFVTISQFEAAFALTNVDSNGSQIMRSEAIPLLVDLMISKHRHTRMRV